MISILIYQKKILFLINIFVGVALEQCLQGVEHDGLLVEERSYNPIYIQYIICEYNTLGKWELIYETNWKIKVFKFIINY